jgi:DNA polymerase III delta subunit
MALIGEDAFLQSQALLGLLASLPRDIQRIDVEGERAEVADVLDEARSYAMFGGSKVVVVRQADEFVARFRESLENYAAHPAPEATLVLRLNALAKNTRLYKAIDKLGGIKACEPPRDVAGWIITRGKQAHQLTVAPQAARLLADLVGADLGRLDNELAKLALMVEGGKVDEKAISAGVAFQREQEMWDMTNALAAGRAAEALRRWRHLVQMDSSAEFRAVTWLGMWLENVRKALAMKKKGMGAATIAQQLRIWPREIQQPFFKTAEALGESGANRALDLLVEVDRQNKSGIGEPATNVERFLLGVGRTQG